MASATENDDTKIPSGHESQQTYHSVTCAEDGRSPSRVSGGGPAEQTDTPQPAAAGKGISLWMAAIFITGEICGSGMLSLPYALTHMGWLGVPLLLVIGLGSGYCASCLSRCWVLMESRDPQLRGRHTQEPLSDIAFKCLGKPGRILAVTCMCFNTFGTCIVYTLVVAQMLQTLLAAYVHMTYCVWILILGLIMIPPTWLGSPKDIRGIGVAALGTTVLTWLLSMVQLSAHFDTLHDSATFHQPDFVTFFLGVGPILYSYGGASALPTIQIDMLHREQFTFSVLLGYLGAVLLFAPLAALGYGSSGDQVERNILQTLKLSTPGLLPTLAELIFVVHLVAAFYVVFNPFAQQMEALAHIPHRLSVKRVLFRTGLMGVLIFLGETIPDFIQIIQLLGSTTIATTAFILPGIMYLMLVRQTDPQGRWDAVPVPIWEKCVTGTMAALGVVVGLTATLMTLLGIIQHGLNSSCLIST